MRPLTLLLAGTFLFMTSACSRGPAVNNSEVRVVRASGQLPALDPQSPLWDAVAQHPAKLMVQDVNITNCANGIRLSTTGGQLLATMDRVRIENMTNSGLEAAAGSTFVTVKRSTINNNNVDGVRASGAATIINLEDNMLAFNNGVAVNASVSGARIRISNNTIMNNNAGVSFVAGGVVESAGNNRIDGNGSSLGPNDSITIQ